VTWLQPIALDTSDYELCVRRWDGTTWTSPAPDLPLGGFVDEPATALDAQGNLFVAWTSRSDPDPAVGGRVTAVRLIGAQWIELGGRLSDMGTGQGISMAVLGGAPYVAFQEGPLGPDYTSSLRVRGWAGGAWRDAGEPIMVDRIMGVQTQLYYPNLVAADGRLLLAFREDSDCQSNPLDPGDFWCNRRWIRVIEWDGSAWQTLGSPLNRDRAQSGYYPSMVLARGRPVVAWKEYPVPTTVFVSERAGADWAALGGGSGTEVGFAVLAVDSGGVPVLAWDDAFGVNVRRLNR
jgi:hypothetical protein